MRRSHPSNLDPKGLRSFDVCSIASTETASTVAGRGRGRAKRRGGGPNVTGEEDDCANSVEANGMMALYSDPFSSMFSPTTVNTGGGMGGLMARRPRCSSGAVGGGIVSSSSAMGPPDARRSHSALIGAKQTNHFRHGAVQSVRVEISPTGSPVSPVPPSSTIAPTMNAFRRCLLLKGRGGIAAGATLSPPPSSTNMIANGSSNTNGRASFCYQADDEATRVGCAAGLSRTHGGSEALTANNSLQQQQHQYASTGASSPMVYQGEVLEEVIEEEAHIFVFDNDESDAVDLHQRSAGKHSHCGGKEKRAAVTRRHQGGGSSTSSVTPYVSTNIHSRPPNPFALSAKRQRKACRSRYLIDEGSDEEDGAAIYYVQVSHSALTPRDGPDDVLLVPQMPLLPSSVATAVVDAELAVLEDLML